jgi:hypothetical protein
MSVTIHESGMDFGPFPSENIFELEKVLKELDFGDHVSMVEFIVRKDSPARNSIVFVEAKSSIPRQHDGFMNEIRVKMHHAITTWFAAVAGRHPKVLTSIPTKLNRVEHLKLPLECFLVIPGVPDTMLPQFSEKFRQTLVSERKLWSIPDVNIQVLNEQKAQKVGLIAPTSPLAR